MKTNIKTIIVNIPSQKHLDKINNTFALKTLFRDELIIGDNEIKVNHFNYSSIVRMQCSIFTVVKLNNILILHT